MDGGTGKRLSVKALSALRPLPSLIEALTLRVLEAGSWSFRPVTLRARFSCASRKIELGEALPSSVTEGVNVRVGAAIASVFGLLIIISLSGLRKSIAPFMPYVGDSAPPTGRQGC